MIQYEHFSPEGDRRSERLGDDEAARLIGGRALAGFRMVQRFVESPDGDFYVIYFQSDITGRVWSVFY